MHSWIHFRAGHPSPVLTLSQNTTAPIANAPKDVLVRISHAALNPSSSMMQLCPFIFRARPAIPELDFSGIFVAAGSAVPEDRRLKPGTAVFGSVSVATHLFNGVGALAEYVAVDSEAVVCKPDNTSFEGAAGLGVAGCTALLLAESTSLKRGDSELVNGASGGIGTMLVQMVRDAVGESGRVAAICSGRNTEIVRKLGADEVGISSLRKGCISNEDCR